MPSVCRDPRFLPQNWDMNSAAVFPGHLRISQDARFILQDLSGWCVVFSLIQRVFHVFFQKIVSVRFITMTMMCTTQSMCLSGTFPRIKMDSFPVFIAFVESEDFGVSGHINVATEAQGNEDTTVEVNDATGATGAGAVAAPSRGIGAAGPTVGGTTGAATGWGAMGVTPLCGINLTNWMQCQLVNFGWKIDFRLRFPQTFKRNLWGKITTKKHPKSHGSPHWIDWTRVGFLPPGRRNSTMWRGQGPCCREKPLLSFFDSLKTYSWWKKSCPTWDVWNLVR